jgi:MoaA/NifB/PqqE/SkfB family radical SAM enzyme
MPPRIAREVERLLAALPPAVKLVVTLSIDGGAATHDRLRGVPGLHARVVTTAEQLVQLRERNPRLALGLNMTVMPANAGEVDEVVALGDSLGIGVMLTPALRSDLYIDSVNARGWDGTPADWRSVSAALRRAAVRSGGTALLDACGVIDGAERRAPCVFWTRGAFLDADGGLYVCPVSRDGRIATIRNPGEIEAAWGGPSHAAALERLRAGACRSCVSNCLTTEADREDVLDHARRDGRPVVIFGAGGGGRKARVMLTRAGIAVRQYVDNAPSLQGQTIDGVPVVAFGDGEACRDALTVVATMTGAGQVAAQLEAAGLVEGRDFVRYF